MYTSGYNGVQIADYDQGKKPWIGRIQIKHKIIRKYFETEIEAAKWYDEQCIRLGRFSKLNFPEQNLKLEAKNARNLISERRT